MVKARKFVLQQHFEGLPKKEDLKIVEEELPPLKDGQFLAEALYLSIDPYMRAFEPTLPLGITMIGRQIAKILESKNPNFPVGKLIFADYGWRTRTIGPLGDTAQKLPRQYILPDFGNLPPSLGLGILGKPGNTAYFGFLEICQPKAGATVVVTAAAGAVGSHVGQIAKIKGCKVIGITGSNEKGKWLTQELGFDHFINYKEPGLEEKLKKFAPNGVDCFFDNVGGEISTTIMGQMNEFGRVAVCGSIAGYLSRPEDRPKATYVQWTVVNKQLTIQGFNGSVWKERFSEGIQQNLQWIKEGKIKYRETITEGFDNMLTALVDGLNGKNFGKSIVKV